jgi:hypothetical protein
MSDRTYGRLRLDGADLDVIRHMLERGRDMCAFKATTAQDAEEEAFYEKTRARSEAMVARFQATKPGRVSFTEGDLAFVRGMVFPTLFPELMAQYARRAELSLEEVDLLSLRITHLSALQQKFDEPRIADKSQDSEPEEEEEEEEDVEDDGDDVEAAPGLR